MLCVNALAEEAAFPSAWARFGIATREDRCLPLNAWMRSARFDFSSVREGGLRGGTFRLRQSERRDPEPCDVQSGQEYEGEQCRDNEPAHHRIGHRSPEYGGGDGDHAENCGCGSEQDRPQPMLSRLDDRIPGVRAVPNLGDRKSKRLNSS